MANLIDRALHRVASVLVCLACAGDGWRVLKTSQQTQGCSKQKRHIPGNLADFSRRRWPVEDLSKLLLACNPAATFHCSSAQAPPGHAPPLGRVLPAALGPLAAPRLSASVMGTAAFQDEQPPVPWMRLWRELRTTSKPACIVPASALSFILTLTELVAPKLRGQCFDAVLQPGCTLAFLRPKLQALAFLAFATWLLNIVSATLFAKARWDATMGARIRLMESVLRQEAAFFDETRPSELAARLISEPERLQEVANRGPERAVNALLSAIGGMVLMLRTEWRLALLAVALRAPLLSRIAAVAGNVVGRYSARQQQAMNEANGLAAEALAQWRTVATHSAAPSMLSDYSKRVLRYMAVIRDTLFAETVLRFTQLGIDALSSYSLLLAGLWSVLCGRMSVGQLIAFQAFAEVFAEGCRTLQALLLELYALRPACSRYFELLDRTPKMKEGGLTPSTSSGTVELRNLSFAFQGQQRSILQGVSLQVEPGEVLAITGPSGSGKSTLLLLLLRLYDPTGGEVLLDGVDMRLLNLSYARSQYGYVPQEPALFDRSVNDNIQLGVEGHLQDDLVAGALRNSGAAGFVDGLTDGVNTRLGEGGRRLSGGQRQRLALARALVREPRVLLLDEPTSSLDGEAEQLVLATLRARAPNTTTIIVAHRASSVMFADRVAVIRNGRLEELGTPAELARAGGWFQNNFYPAKPT